MTEVQVTPSMRVRAALPDAFVPAVVRARLWAKRRRPGPMERARVEMQYLLGAVASERVEPAAAAYVVRDVMRSEMRYHPRLVVRQDVENAVVLTRARSTGRGVVVSFLHHGHYEGTTAALALADAPFGIVVSPEMLAPDAPTFLRQHVRAGTSTGNQTVDAGLGGKELAARLSRGETLAIATDVPGTSVVPFLGRDRRGSSGAARLAAATNSLVVTLHAHCESDGRQWVRVGEAIEPRDFPDAEELLRHLVSTQEGPVLAWPEAYHQPSMRWGEPETSAVPGAAAGS